MSMRYEISHERDYTMLSRILLLCLFIAFFTDISAVLNSYQNFVNSIRRQSIDDLADILRRRLSHFKKGDNKQVELILLIDGSSSVGETNFENEVNFVGKLVADLIVGPQNTRVAIVVFDTHVTTYVNHLNGSDKYEKCSFLQHELGQVRYSGGNTYTLGALQQAAHILDHSRPHAKKVVFLITDGFSNNGDPVPVAADLKMTGTKFFVFAIKSGNVDELLKMSSPPSEEHAFFLESFSEFEALARRALHEDLSLGVYTEVHDASSCAGLCSSNNSNNSSCCNANATCSCGSLSGHFACVCPPGYFGSGLVAEPCLPCPKGTYNDGKVPGDISVCRPCPGNNQNSKRHPATSLADCVCDDGFMPSTTSCVVVTCPVSSPPKNGYFVKENCSNVLNAACGVRCDIGYELIGSSVRICQKNGSWTGEQPVCHPKKCQELKPIDFGEVLCKHDDEGLEVLVEYGAGGVKRREIVKRKLGQSRSAPMDNAIFAVDTECDFGCPHGFSLIGSKKRTCLPIRKWNGLQPTCKPITCPALPMLANGAISPASCTQRGVAHNYGTVCNVSCNSGYFLKGNTSRQCTGKHGTWTGKGQSYKCADVEPPKISCPGNVSLSTLPDSYIASVEILLPLATDNSGLQPIVWADNNVTVLPVGEHQISIHAVDPSGNSAVCSFWIIVKDTEKPKMENCSSPDAMTLAELLQLDWEEPSFFDNSGNITVLKEHNSDFNGSMTFNYTAVDPSGNSATCLIVAKLLDLSCPEPSPVSNTVLNCTNVEGLTGCQVMCKPGFASADIMNITNITVTCERGQWVPYSSFNLINCSEITMPKELIATGEIFVKSDDLCGHNDNDTLQDLTNQILNIVDDNNMKLSLECIKSAGEELTNSIASRRRRSSVQKITKINFKITGNWTNYNKFFYETEDSPAELLRSRITNGSTLSVNGHPIVLDRIETKHQLLLCENGSKLFGNICVKCAAGHYFHVGECVPCAIGSYQSREGALDCFTCPLGTTTLLKARTSFRDCKRVCPSGTYGSKVNADGVAVSSCWACPRGQQQPLPGQTSCVSCWGAASTSAQCRDIHTTHNCTLHSCGPHGTCSPTNGFCLCSPGYFGSKCDLHFNPCDSAPCSHGGTCSVKTATTFACACPEGYHGSHCQWEVDFCSSTPCHNNATCTSLHHGFHCDCHHAFAGETCDSPVNTCSLLQPCLNNGTCTDLASGSFKCECMYNYSGKYCDKYLGCLPEDHLVCHPKMEPDCIVSGNCSDVAGLNMNSVFSFAKGSATDCLIADIDYPSLKELSACIWVKTEDRFNFGTLFSLASDNTDNEFTLTDYNGLVLYVQGQRVVTDVVVNDGFWHFICVTWRTIGGTWNIYVDGVATATGSGLAAGAAVNCRGTFVVGQDQDFQGGGFNPIESFVGKLSKFRIWRQVLGARLIAALSESCNSIDEGSINDVEIRLLWSIRGNVKVENSKFCMKCGEPPGIFRADVSVEGRTGTYKCHDGFLMKFPDNLRNSPFANWTRKCQISGEWQPNPPICSRISCGFPGVLSHGSILGRSYLYEDIIQHKCSDGFQLVGSHIRTCLSNGSWSDVKPYCKRNSSDVATACPALTPPRRGSLFFLSNRPDLEDESLVGDTAEFTCDDGYTLNGSDLLECLPSGSWSHQAPVCVPCPQFPIPC